MLYNALDWYWDNGTQVFSSSRQLLVAYADAAYQAWLAKGNIATKHPGDTELRNVLAVYGLGLSPAETAVIQRTRAAALASDPDFKEVLLRAVLLVAVDEINLLRERLVAQDAVVAAATTLADLKTRWATLATAQPLPDRTAAQAKTALVNKINGGGAD